MSDFSAAREAMDQGLGDPSQDREQNTNTGDQAPGDPQTQQDVAQAITELEKLEKFKYQGQEWTPKDLEKAILRQKDYTQKTQGLAEDRKSLESERQYYEKLAWDLLELRQNPHRVNEFVKLYPEKFHSYAAQVLKQASNQTQAQNQVQQQPQHDVETLSRLERLEKFYNEQEIAKNELQINQTIESLSQKYPNAANFKEMVLGRAFEAHSQGTKLDTEAWENIFKQVDEQVNTTLKSKYSDFVKKQQAANAKAKDVGSGGGTAGGAPKKFKNLSEVTKFAVEDLAGRGR